MTDNNNDSECHPLDNVEDVVFWKPPDQPNWARFVKPLTERAKHCFKLSAKDEEINRKFYPASSVPKTLVCHDFKGGYLNDRFVYGIDAPHDYKFLHWSYIDTFVYFSHRLITIPPIGWINAGHCHGVRVLGTILTEGEKGHELWHKLCRDVDTLKEFASQLAMICYFYDFDGYLINIENEIEHSHMTTFLNFVADLSRHLKSTREDKMLIWYDAVTITGKLKWQNKLNKFNKPFFDLCDGIFLNYHWSETDLSSTKQTALLRNKDVYVGIDVFGRGCVGGFEVHEAVKEIRRHDLSVAIFAPGWVHECCRENENVSKRDYQFWSLLLKYFYIYGPSTVPFTTSFCRGYGFKIFENGTVKGDIPWFNLTRMNYQIATLTGISGAVEKCCILHYEHDGFQGGGCLLITQQPYRKGPHGHVDRLFICDFKPSAGKKLVMTVVTKPLYGVSDTGFDLIVTIMDPELLSAIASPEVSSLPNSYDEYKRKICLKVTPVSAVEREKTSFWTISEFEVCAGTGHIVEVGIRLTGECSPMMLGLFSIEEEALIQNPEDQSDTNSILESETNIPSVQMKYAPMPESGDEEN